jgi:DtxR family Mn-dependent transcriptional regulator
VGVISANVSASQEDYLEAVFLIAREKGAARAKDIAAWLGVTAASVTGALHALAEKGLVNYAPYELVRLTSEGEKVAQAIVRRHAALKNFFVKVLAVAEGEAESAACAMEHALPRQVLERLIHFVRFMDEHQRTGPEWMAKDVPPQDW